MRAAQKRREAQHVIENLKKDAVLAECQSCNGQFRLRDSALFFHEDFTPEALSVYRGMLQSQRERSELLRERGPRISALSESGAHAVNLGRILERLAPCLDDFCCNSGDCRSLFDPIDYVAFEGLSKGKITKLLFLEVKTGGSRLTTVQKQIKSLVQDKRVAFDLYDRGKR